jgi:phosphoserine phosphatase RsbU/P
MTRRDQPLRRYAALASLLLITLVYQGRVAYEVVRGLRPVVDARRPVAMEMCGPTITSTEVEAEAAGVRSGDRLLAVEGRPFRGLSVLALATALNRPGQTLRLTVERDGVPFDADVQLASRSAPPSSWGQQGVTVVIGLAMPLVCLLVGFSVAALKPRDLQAWLLLGLMLGFSHFSRNFVARDIPSWGVLRVPALVISDAFFIGWVAFLFLFGLYFPERFEFERRRPWLKWVLLGPLLLVGATEILVDLGQSENFSLARWLVPFHQASGGPGLALRMSMIGAFFAALGTKAGRATASDARRRLKLLYAGARVAMTPSFLLVLGSLATAGHVELTLFPPWLYLPALAAMFVFPLTMAYVVVVHRALEVQVVVRQGVQYALARGGLRVLQVLITFAVVFSAAWLLADPAANRPQKIKIIGWAVLAGILVQRFGTRLAGWVDRRFFREAYDAEQILSELADEVRTMVETAPLLRHVIERISASLHVPKAAVLVRDGGYYRPAVSRGYAAPPEVAFAETSGTVRRLKQEAAPVRVYLDDSESWVRTDPDVDPRERDALETLETQLVLPFAVRDELLGFMSLGPKQSEAPYSGVDLRLLRSVATQTGLALENSRLTEAIAREVAQRERHRRELEIAREVQEQLFPQNLPAVPGLDYAGHCRPALGVGGDYYDFLGLPDGRFGLAIGDVAGKGISAALLMASLQASLRGQTLNGASDLAGLMGNVNRLIYEASLSNRYATFFYAQYEPTSRELSYVNAGHNAPMLFRDGEVIRLEVGGAVVGMLPVFPYQQGSIPLRPGDLLVAYTDGISEAMNPADEEWGEERLMAAVRRCPDLPAEPMLRHLLASADAFVAGAKQHDDMTLVVVRVG